MYIINTNSISCTQYWVRSSKRASIRLLIFLTFTALILSGCAKTDSFTQAQNAAKKSREYYQRSVGQYKSLISKGKELDRLNFELGLLYFDHGEYESASECLQASKLSESGKYLAISSYKRADFTYALNLFKQMTRPDAESLYYYGRTCEKLNLFDDALKAYRSISDEPYKSKGQDRIKIITQENANLKLSDLDISIQNIIRQAPDAQKYPNAGALILYVDEKFELSENNTGILYQHFMVKILNERGKEDFSEIVIDYDSTDEKVELEYARIIRPDGAVIPVGTRHIRDVSKYLNFPLYSNAKAMIISFPEVSQGAILEYKLKIHRTELINKKDFVIPYTVQDTEPVIYARLSVDIPQGRPLHYKILNAQYNTYNAGFEPKIYAKETSTEYIWEFKDIPQIIPESNMPPLAQICPIILLSTFNSWSELYDWWWSLAKDKIKADSAIKAKVAELTAGKNTLNEKARAIYNFCAKDIRYVAVEYGQAGYEPHNAADIFSNKYGDCKDQAILLVTMLKEIGAEAYPVLIPTKEAINLQEDFPGMYFNHCIAMVKMDKENVFLDPTASTCSFGDLPADDQERRVIVFRQDGYNIDTTLLYSAQHNKLVSDLKIKVAADETITAQRGIFTYGHYDQMQRAWLLYTPPESISQALEERIQDVCVGGQLIRYKVKHVDDLNTPATLEYSFSGMDYWARAGALRILPPLADVDTSLVAKKARSYPIDLGVPQAKTVELLLVIPSQFKVKYLPEDTAQESPWINASVRYQEKGNTIHFIQETQINKNTVSPQEYPEFKKFLEDFSRQVQQRVVLEKK